MNGLQNYSILTEKIESLEKENLSLKNSLIEINQAKELYLKIFEDFPALIWRSRIDMKCDYFNKTWLDFTGRTMEQEFGDGWTEGLHPEDFEKCISVYVEAFEKRLPFVMEYRMKNKEGVYCWIRDFGRPFYDLDNSFLGYIGSCYDVTNIKIDELNLIKLNETKDKLFSVISHDLKNPINAIIGLTDMLEKKIQKNEIESAAEYVKNINLSTQRVRNLLVNLLEWSISQHGKIGFHPVNIHLRSIIDEVIDLTKEMLNQKSISIELNCIENDNVFVDREMIASVLRNFLTNAIKFSNTGGCIQILCEGAEEKINVTIKDNGIGMSEKVLNSLFKIGETISIHGTNNEKGTGIGLLLCKEFLDKHQSELIVESKKGKGSTFKFSLPVKSKISEYSSENI
ncbi:MAG: PAS domain-containing sensor histidine kinase [Bacteroidota bacterium]